MAEYVFCTATGIDSRKLHKLWRQCFGDTASFIHCYDSLLFRPEEVDVALWEDTPVAMSTFIPAQLYTARGEKLSISFGYGLATAPEHQGHGVAARLMRAAFQRTYQRGVDCVVFIPDTESLFDYYSRTTFAYNAFYVREVSLSGAEASRYPPVHPTSTGAENYQMLRERCLSGKTHMCWDAWAVGFQKAVCQDCGGDLFCFDTQEPCCAVAEYEKDGSLTVGELLASEEMIGPCLAGLLALLPARRVTVRLPVWSAALGGEVRPFGMLEHGKTGNPRPELRPEAYLGLDFC